MWQSYQLNKILLPKKNIVVDKANIFRGLALAYHNNSFEKCGSHEAITATMVHISPKLRVARFTSSLYQPYDLHPVLKQKYFTGSMSLLTLTTS